MTVTEDILDRREPLNTDVISVFSVDVEDYFHVEAFRQVVDVADWGSMEQRVVPNTRRLLAVLAEFDVKATFFVLGWVAERNPALVIEVHEAGHEIGIHGYNHRPITTMTPLDFREDIRHAKALVEDLIGEAVLGYRAPTYSVVQDTLWALDILAEEGLVYDSSIFPIMHDRYGIPNADRYPWQEERSGRSFAEFPISTVRFAGRNFPFVGGGYLRLLPMRYVLWGMRRVTVVERRPCMVYIHPWEIDPGQPRLQVGRAARFRHYGRLAGVEHRIRRLLKEFSFSTTRSVLGL